MKKRTSRGGRPPLTVKSASLQSKTTRSPFRAGIPTQRILFADPISNGLTALVSSDLFQAIGWVPIWNCFASVQDGNCKMYHHPKAGALMRCICRTVVGNIWVLVNPYKTFPNSISVYAGYPHDFA